MSDAIGDGSLAQAAEMQMVACPTDASLNRVPPGKARPEAQVRQVPPFPGQGRRAQRREF